MHMNFYWFIFHLEKNVAERRDSALLWHSMYASSIYPAHQVRAEWKCKPDLGVLFRSILCRTKLNCTARWKRGIYDYSL